MEAFWNYNNAVLCLFDVAVSPCTAVGVGTITVTDVFGQRLADSDRQ